MKAYICGRYGRRKEFRIIEAVLQSLGISVCARWLHGDHELTPATGPSNAHFATEDLEDVQSADLVFVFTEPPNPRGRNRGGRHVEFGIALQKKALVVIIGPRENVFHWLPEVWHYETWEDCRRAEPWQGDPECEWHRYAMPDGTCTCGLYRAYSLAMNHSKQEGRSPC